MQDWPTFHDHPPEQVSITYSLEQHGWTSMNVVVGSLDVAIGSFGYCTDALGDLVRAAVAMAAGASDAQVIVDGEPMLWGLAISDGWQSTLSPQACQFSIRRRSCDNDTSASRVSSWPEVLAQGYVTADAFATALSRAAHEVLTEYGEERYLAQWIEHPFPTRALAALDAALATPPPQPRTGSPLSA